MNKQDARELLKKYKAGTATEAEKELLGDWILFGELKDNDLTDDEIADDIAIIDQRLPLHQARPVKWLRLAIAASVMVCLSVAGYHFLNKQKSKPEIAQVTPKPDPAKNILPGGNKAYLTLSNGKKIALTGAANGQIATQSGLTITKTRNGQLVYHIIQAKQHKASAAITFNTIETPRGGQYQVVLPDGTQVWLNAASSLRYPTSFAANSREVSLRGEAYFEVAHDAARPFRVLSKGQRVEVLGTHFNINAYDDDAAIQTTLLEGSVKLSNKSGQVLLKPGQQAVLNNSGNDDFNVKNVDATDAIAWKNGYFLFKNENIQSVMKKVARWYDVDIEYDGDVYERRLGGTVSKFENIGDLLHTIQLTHSVHFKVIGRRVMVMP